MKTLTNRALLAAAILAAAAFIVVYARQQQDSGGKYAEVNGLKMYYEIHGSGRPLVLLHGAFGFAEGWGAFLLTLTKTHQVIAIELQGHGHTNDIDRPLTFEQMADDTAALLKQLKIKDAYWEHLSLERNELLCVSRVRNSKSLQFTTVQLTGDAAGEVDTREVKSDLLEKIDRLQILGAAPYWLYLTNADEPVSAARVEAALATNA